MKLTLYTIKNPCSSCFIVQNLVWEVVCRVAEEKTDIETELIELDSKEAVKRVPFLEVELFPALFANEEQISAGNILHKRQLLKLLENIGTI